ncbi:MAG TPA: KH domain-containing protein [Actinomycetota bacterium]|nr:KH domain-containing protein [Actinomycetota bacterium]
MSRELLEYAVPWLVDNPDDIEITEIKGEQGGSILELSVHPDDVGKVIGKRGRIIRSLRTLSKAAGQKSGASVTVEVVD